MAEYMPVADISEVTEGKMKTVIVNGVEILLAMSGGKYYAVDNRCTHMGGNLSMGTLQGTVISCPLHKSEYDITDGHVIRWTDWTGLKLKLAKMARSPKPLKTYEVKVEGNKILVTAGTAFAAMK